MRTSPTATVPDTTPAAATTGEATISGVKLNFTAKGLIQPEITTRYANAAEALEHAVTDAFTLYDRITAEAARRGLMVVTEVAS